MDAPQIADMGKSQRLTADSATFTEEGFMMGTKAKVRETMSKKGSKEITHKLEMDQGKGYQLVAEDTCKK